MQTLSSLLNFRIKSSVLSCTLHLGLLRNHCVQPLRIPCFESCKTTPAQQPRHLSSASQLPVLWITRIICFGKSLCRNCLLLQRLNKIYIKRGNSGRPTSSLPDDFLFLPVPEIGRPELHFVSERLSRVVERRLHQGLIRVVSPGRRSQASALELRASYCRC